MEKGNPSGDKHDGDELPKSNLTREEMMAHAGEEWTGKCKWFNVTRGFGFIVSDAYAHDVFVHQSELRMPGFRSLDEGESVRFTVRVGKGGFEAADVHGCEEPLKGSSIRPLGKKKDKMIRCYKCGQLGFHLAAKCKKEFESSKVCYFCHKTNHLLADCPEYSKRNRKSGKTEGETA